MGSTIIEKILGRAAGREPYRPGDVAVCRPDMVVQTELGWARGWNRPKKLFDTSRVVVIIDHAVPAPTIRDAAGNTEGRRFAQEFGLKIYDVGRHGIGNFFAGEIGLIRPGEVLVGSDSHLCTVGAFNCAGRGVGPLDLLQGMTKGLVWYVVNPTIRYEFKGKMQPLVSGKDVFFHIAQEYGAHTNLNLEFGGPGLAAIQMSDRRTMATMCAELGAEFATFEFDDITAKFFEGRVSDALTPVAPDADAEYLDRRVIDLDQIEPYVILPHSVPKNGVRMSAFDKKIKIDQAFIGSCANGQIEDFRVAASILKGKKIAPSVRLIMTPAAQSVYLQAVREGLVETLVEAGAVVTNSTCGACFGYSMGVLGPNEVCITASTRNFKGRMGIPEAEIYLGSPATVAASALTGIITDPRTLTSNQQRH